MSRSGSSCSADPSVDTRPHLPPPTPRRRPGWRSTLLTIGLIGSLSLALAAPPAAAESPTEVAAELQLDGVFVAPGREADEAALTQTVQEARARGIRVVVVLPNDPQPTVASFARRVMEAADADAAVIFPAEGGLEAHTIEEFESANLRAESAARSKSTPADAVEAYAEQLLTEPERRVPPIVGQVITIVILLALVLAAAVASEQLLRRMLRPSTDPKSPSSGNQRRDLAGRAGKLVDR
ncbi:MAG: DUF6676 family protein [Actinomycetota bacterium]